MMRKPLVKKAFDDDVDDDYLMVYILFLFLIVLSY
jgi:hypothetical protein